MNFFTAVKTCFVKYTNFSDRASRTEFWLFTLFLVLADFIVSSMQMDDVFILATIIPSIAVTVRRLHDIDRSGWWTLICFIPLFGMLWLIYWLCKKGDTEENRFGPHPVA